MAISIQNATEEDIATVLHRGMMSGIRHELKQSLMISLEKEIDTAIEKAINGLKGYVEMQRGFNSSLTEQLVFNIKIERGQV